jgi:hypothetical protein
LCDPTAQFGRLPAARENPFSHRYDLLVAATASSQPPLHRDPDSRNALRLQNLFRSPRGLGNLKDTPFQSLSYNAIRPISSTIRAVSSEPPLPGAAVLYRGESYFGSIPRRTRAIRGQKPFFTRLADLMVFVPCHGWCDGAAPSMGQRRRAGLTEPAPSLC